MIRLRFTQDAGFNPWVIRTYTWCEFNHVEVCLPNGYLAARPERGVDIYGLDEHKPIKQAFGVIYSDAATDRKIMTFLESQLHKPYDWTAIYGIAAHRDWREQDSWVCSELIAGACEDTPVRLFNGGHVNRYSPRDLFINSNIHLEYPYDS